MPLPTRFLLGSPLKLGIAIALFVLLDLSVLVINLWIANQVSRDAVAINLAGRQRMLSQQITKSLLLINQAPNETSRMQAREELADAYELFATTLRAFDQGGVTKGGDGTLVHLRRVEPNGGRGPLDVALLHVAPLAERLDKSLNMPSAAADDFRWAMDYMIANNREILARMNDLTFVLEQHSVSRIREMRAIQTGAFALALINFLVIVLGLVKQYHFVRQDRRRWRELAQRDALTGLFNRAALRETLERQVAEANRESQAFSLLLLDLDGFKPINDRFGHAAGDELLKKLANTLLGLARESDIVARLGGDEFALVCPNLSGADQIRHFSDRVVHGIANMECSHGGNCSVHASIGVAIYPTHGTSTDELLAAADRAMYQSKGAGGNCWNQAELNR
ncbi:MAG: diguanylate cyclase [Pseudomonadota bacterium]|nr:diguanylate cyclase [Pseudomonadota bacterium]MDP1903314.1 diguanylate cyclase [Pseudomonadota bacterium]MDP2352295.1 diguanylate cyclase [Pseudomonadota bacterium]